MVHAEIVISDWSCGMFSAFTAERLQVLMGVESVWKDEAGLEYDQLLPRKLRNADLTCTAWERRGTLKLSSLTRMADCF
jgi:hypothetical protein